MAYPNGRTLQITENAPRFDLDYFGRKVRAQVDYHGHNYRHSPQVDIQIRVAIGLCQYYTA